MKTTVENGPTTANWSGVKTPTLAVYHKDPNCILYVIEVLQETLVGFIIAEGNSNSNGLLCGDHSSSWDVKQWKPAPVFTKVILEVV